MKEVKVRVIRSVAVGYLLQYTHCNKFQFVKDTYLQDLGGPSSPLQVGDEFFLPSGARDGINWQDSEIRDVNLLNVGNSGQWGENVILRDLEKDETIQLSSGHIINSDCAESYDVPVSDWCYGPHETYKLAATPYGWSRAETYSGCTDKFQSEDDNTDWLDHFFEDEENQS